MKQTLGINLKRDLISSTELRLIPWGTLPFHPSVDIKWDKVICRVPGFSILRIRLQRLGKDSTDLWRRYSMVTTSSPPPPLAPALTPPPPSLTSPGPRITGSPPPSPLYPLPWYPPFRSPGPVSEWRRTGRRRQPGLRTATGKTRTWRRWTDTSSGTPSTESTLSTRSISSGSMITASPTTRQPGRWRLLLTISTASPMILSSPRSGDSKPAQDSQSPSLLTPARRI